MNRVRLHFQLQKRVLISSVALSLVIAASCLGNEPPTQGARIVGGIQGGTLRFKIVMAGSEKEILAGVPVKVFRRNADDEVVEFARMRSSSNGDVALTLRNWSEEEFNRLLISVEPHAYFAPCVMTWGEAKALEGNLVLERGAMIEGDVSSEGAALDRVLVKATPKAPAESDNQDAAQIMTKVKVLRDAHVVETWSDGTYTFTALDPSLNYEVSLQDDNIESTVVKQSRLIPPIDRKSVKDIQKALKPNEILVLGTDGMPVPFARVTRWEEAREAGNPFADDRGRVIFLNDQWARTNSSGVLLSPANKTGSDDKVMAIIPEAHFGAHASVVKNMPWGSSLQTRLGRYLRIRLASGRPARHSGWVTMSTFWDAENESVPLVQCRYIWRLDSHGEVVVTNLGDGRQIEDIMYRGSKRDSQKPGDHEPLAFMLEFGDESK